MSLRQDLKAAKTLFEEIVSSISIYDRKESSAITFRILEHFNIRRTDVLSGKMIPFDREKELEEILKRVNRHEPLQYILGETEFYGRTFKVSSQVLIPRPETEELVEMIIRENKQNTALRIMDIGTGSGCIAVSLAKDLPSSKVHALDVSKEALQVAEKNAQLHSADIHFIHSDILVNATEIKNTIRDLDIIVSNPPYVRNSEKKEMLSNVLDFEPHQALFVDDTDPLLFYKAILDFAQTTLTEGGQCYLEINEHLGREMTLLLKEKKFSEIRIVNDLHGKNRFACGKSRK